MNILIVGNGFDLAHGLPTKYADFLKFIDFFYKHKAQESSGLELIAGEDGRKIESALNRKSVSLAVSHNLQLHSFSEEDHDLLVVPLGKLASKGRFNFLDDFGCGKGVSTG